MISTQYTQLCSVMPTLFEFCVEIRKIVRRASFTCAVELDSDTFVILIILYFMYEKFK